MKWDVLSLIMICLFACLCGGTLGCLLGRVIANTLQLTPNETAVRIDEACKVSCRLANYDAYEVAGNICWCVTPDTKINLASVPLRCGVYSE